MNHIVLQGLRYRFRLVNAGFLNCPLELSVDNHTLLVIASDGADIKPVRGEQCSELKNLNVSLA